MAVYTDELITLVEHKYFLGSLHSFFIDLPAEIGLECEAKYQFKKADMLILMLDIVT